MKRFKKNININLFTCLLLVSTLTVNAQNLFPTFVEEGNPYINSTFTSSNVGTTNLSSNSFARGSDVNKTALAYCHPQSPYYGDTLYRDRLFFLMDTISANTSSISDFSFFPGFAHAYALLKAAHPDEISAARQAHYEMNLINGSNSLVSSRGNIWTEKQVNLVWYNADVRWALGVYLTGIAVGDDNLKSYGEAFFDFDFQNEMVFEDGGIYYVGFQNECFTYHYENIYTLAWYYLISEDPGVRDIILKSVPYYPLSTYRGVGEYYTSVSWKHYWNLTSANSAGAAFIVGSIAEDPYNYDLGRSGGQAFFYNPNLTNPIINQPDNYTVYDRNILGPRGRYGLFGYAASSRIVDNFDNFPEATIGVGKNTIAGAHVLNESGSGFPYDAALDIVGLEIKYQAGEETSDDRRRKHRFLTTNEKTSTTNAKQIHGLTSTYNPSTKVNATTAPFSEASWVFNEQWVFMPDRLVGHLTVNSSIDNHQVYGIGSIVKLVAGRASWGTQKDIVDLGNGHYSYGRLHFIIKEQNLNGETITEYGAVYGSATNKCSHHRIIDSKSSGNPEGLFSYDISDKYYYVVEIFEEGTQPAIVTSARQNNLHLLTVDDGSKKLLSAMNITNQNQSYTANLGTSNYTEASILKSWAADLQFGSNSPANENLNIPAYNSILLIESSNADDIDVNELYYEDVFDVSVECPIGAPCNDGNPCTANDTFVANCQCESGPLLDSNSNDTCDFEECFPVLASHHNGNIAVNTLDGDLTTYWEADAGEFIEYCLDDIRLLEAISIAFFRGNEQTIKFDIETSMDGETWTSLLCNATSNGITTDLQTFKFHPIQAKKIRIIGYGNSADNLNSIAEVKWHTVIYLEAEDAAIVGQWVLESDSTASASAYVVDWSVNDFGPTESDALIYNFEVSSAGDYHIWARTIAPNGNDDSFWIKVDDGDWALWSVPRTADWRWNKILNATYTLTVGTHRLYVHYRENGAKLDKLSIAETNLGAPIEPDVVSTDFNGVYFEAECANLVGVWEIENDTNASSGGYVVNNALSNSNPSDATSLFYDFNILNAGDYIIWGRTIAPNAGDDSFWIKVDSSNYAVWNGIPGSTDWRWNKMLNGTIYSLTAGTHRLYVHYRENGAKLDKIYIASPDVCAPQGVFGATVNCIPNCTVGTICDDGDDCTRNDVYDNNCNCNGILIDENNDSICDCVDIQLQVWLEGAFDSNANQMTTNLQLRGLLPGQTPTSGLVPPTPAGQPYNTTPWNYTGTEGKVWSDIDYTGNETDWVLVSFRTGITKDTEVAQTAALIMQDGVIELVNRCALSSSISDSLYIVLQHRNHIGVMTPQPVEIVNGILTYDFRASDSYRDQTSFGQKQLSNGEWAMFAGDANQMDFPSFDVNGTDKTEWFNSNGVFDYYLSPDFNLDGDVNGQDKSLWFDNNGISSRVPK